ncbi:MAG: type II secretion system protein [Planctomycetota bacterium]|jgi:prepilin-type N-terminal cleavage/methylation domain-containing protein
MLRREKGFTLIEILVVITIIAALVGMVTLVIPQANKAKEKSVCMNNLKNIGDILIAKKAGKGWVKYSGAAFLLQIANEVKDEDLVVYVCPGEEGNPDDPRPESGSAEFIEMYRSMKLQEGVEDRYTSYSGPNWKQFPEKRAGRESLKTRIIGCDKCRDGAPHHDGIVVLYDTSKVGFMELEELTGHDEEQGLIIVGGDSPDERLQKMCFFPPQ